MLVSSREEFIHNIEENQGILHKVCGMFCSITADKEDLYQEIILQLWKSWPKFRGDSKISTWMYRVALNTAISMTARNKKHKNTRQLDQQSFKQADEGGSAITQEDIQLLHQAIATLSEIERAIILLYLEEKSYDEIAEILGMTRTNVGVRIMRIKKKIERVMKKELVI